MHDQISFPARVLLIERATERRYTADAIPAGDLPDLERDLGACCKLDGGPRYIVDGVERPNFDPTIPDDLYAAGWRWHGGWLRHIADGAAPGASGIVIGMPRESLSEVWEQARKVTSAGEKIRAELATAKAQKVSKKPKRQPASVRAPEPAPVTVVTPPTYAQATMELI